MGTIVSKFASSNAAVTSAYTNPTNAYADDTNYATVNPTKGTNTVVHDFGFADFTSSDIPDGSTINSVQMSARCWGANAAVTHSLQGRDNGANSGSPASTTATAETTITVTLAGVTLADLRSASTLLKARMSLSRTGNTSYQASLDWIDIDVDYTPPAAWDPAEALGAFQDPSAQPDVSTAQCWFDADYLAYQAPPLRVAAAYFRYQRAITIDTTAAGANVGALTDFPIAVVVNASSWPDTIERGHFFDASNVSGKRVDFFAADGVTSLAYEVAKYDAATQSAVYWVRVPAIAGNSTTDIIVGYGSDPNGFAQDAAASVWDSGFAGVWHLDASSLTDSKNSRVLATTNTTVGTGISVDDRVFNGTSSTLNQADQAWHDLGTSFTLELWVKPAVGIKSQPQNYPGLFGKGSTWGAYQYALYFDKAGGSLQAVSFKADTNQYANSFISDASGIVTASVWHHVSWSVDAVQPQSGIYIDGTGYDVNSNYFVGTPRTDQTGVLEVGRVAGTYPFSGDFDEVRISTVGRSADWLRATWFSLKGAYAGADWLTLGPEVIDTFVRFRRGEPIRVLPGASDIILAHFRRGEPLLGIASTGTPPTPPPVIDIAALAALWPDASGQQDVARVACWYMPETGGEFVYVPPPLFDAAPLAGLWPDASGQQDVIVQPVWHTPEHAQAPPLLPPLFALDPSLLGDLWHDHSGQQARSTWPVWYRPEDAQESPLPTALVPVAALADWTEQPELQRWQWPTWYAPEPCVECPLPAPFYPVGQLVDFTSDPLLPATAWGVDLSDSFVPYIPAAPAFDPSSVPWTFEPELPSTQPRWVVPELEVHPARSHPSPVVITGYVENTPSDGVLSWRWPDGLYAGNGDQVKIFANDNNGAGFTGWFVENTVTLTDLGLDYTTAPGVVSTYHFTWTRDPGLVERKLLIQLYGWVFSDPALPDGGTGVRQGLLSNVWSFVPSPAWPAVVAQPDLSLQEVGSTYPRWYDAGSDADAEPVLKHLGRPYGLSLYFGSADDTRVYWMWPPGMGPNDGVNVWAKWYWTNSPAGTFNVDDTVYPAIYGEYPSQGVSTASFHHPLARAVKVFAQSFRGDKFGSPVFGTKGDVVIYNELDAIQPGEFWASAASGYPGLEVLEFRYDWQAPTQQPDTSLQEAQSTYPRWYDADALATQEPAFLRMLTAPTNVNVVNNGNGTATVTWTDPPGMVALWDVIRMWIYPESGSFARETFVYQTNPGVQTKTFTIGTRESIQLATSLYTGMGVDGTLLGAPTAVYLIPAPPAPDYPQFAEMWGADVSGQLDRDLTPRWYAPEESQAPVPMHIGWVRTAEPLFGNKPAWLFLYLDRTIWEARESGNQSYELWAGPSPDALVDYTELVTFAGPDEYGRSVGPLPWSTVYLALSWNGDSPGNTPVKNLGPISGPWYPPALEQAIQPDLSGQDGRSLSPRWYQPDTGGEWVYVPPRDPALDTGVIQDSSAQPDISLRVTNLAGNIETGGEFVVLRSYRDLIVADAPYAYWRLGEAAGPTAVDVMGHLPGTYQGTPTYSQPSAIVNDADTSVRFNVPGDHVTFAAPAWPATFSFEGWARPEDWNSDAAIVGNWQGLIGAMLFTTGDGAGTVGAGVNMGNIGAGSAWWGGYGITGWHHFVGTFDGTHARLYVDGVLRGEPQAQPAPGANTYGKIGQYSTVGLGRGGRIDEVAWYNYALTPAQILAHYRMGITYLPPVLDELWGWDALADRSTQPRWYDADSQAETRVAVPIYTTIATVEQMSALWPEQPGQERWLWPRWYDPSVEPVNEPDFVYWLYWVARGPVAATGGVSGVLLDVDTGEAFLSLGGVLIVKAT